MQPLRKHIHVVKTGERQPAPADSVEQIRRDAEALAVRLTKLAVKPKRDEVPLEATAKQAKALRRMMEIKNLMRDLEAEAEVLKADLQTELDAHNANQIVGPTGRLCAEPCGASVQVRLPCVRYTLRT